MPVQWRNEIWQSLEEGAGKRCSETQHATVEGHATGLMASTLLWWSATAPSHARVIVKRQCSSDRRWMM